jgi:hypothetical protein
MVQEVMNVPLSRFNVIEVRRKSFAAMNRGARLHGADRLMPVGDPANHQNI